MSGSRAPFLPARAGRAGRSQNAKVRCGYGVAGGFRKTANAVRRLSGAQHFAYCGSPVADAASAALHGPRWRLADDTLSARQIDTGIVSQRLILRTPGSAGEPIAEVRCRPKCAAQNAALVRSGCLSAPVVWPPRSPEVPDAWGLKACAAHALFPKPECEGQRNSQRNVAPPGPHASVPHVRALQAPAADGNQKEFQRHGT